MLCSGSANEAVAAVASLAEKPRAILADYHLDLGATGLEAIKAVRQALGVEIPAVVITADHSPEVQALLREACVPLFRKPLKAAALRSVVMHFVTSQRAAAE